MWDFWFLLLYPCEAHIRWTDAFCMFGSYHETWRRRKRRRCEDASLKKTLLAYYFKITAHLMTTTALCSDMLSNPVCALWDHHLFLKRTVTQNTPNNETSSSPNHPNSINIMTSFQTEETSLGSASLSSCRIFYANVLLIHFCFKENKWKLPADQ